MSAVTTGRSASAELASPTAGPPAVRAATCAPRPDCAVHLTDEPFRAANQARGWTIGLFATTGPAGRKSPLSMVVRDANDRRPGRSDLQRQQPIPASRA